MIIRVGAAAIFDKNQRVLCCRRDASSTHPGKWEFPGGKIEFGESTTDCIIREISEELNLLVSPLCEILTVNHRYGVKEVSIELWHCVISEDSPVLEMRCHSENRWLHAHEMNDLEWLDADFELVEYLLNYQN